MRTLTTLFVIAATVAMSFQSCTNKVDKLQEEIEALETREIQNGDSKKELNQKYEEFALAYPEHEKSQIYLENAVLYNNLTDNYQKSIELADIYLERYAQAQNRFDIFVTKAKAYMGLKDFAKALDQFNVVYGDTTYKMSIGDQRFYGEAIYQRIQDTTLENREKLMVKYAGIVEVTNGKQAAIPILEEIYTTYPKSELAPFAMMKHETILEEFGDSERAKALLERIIAEYPESNFARDAQQMLDNDLVGLTAEEQLEAILSKKNAN